MSAGVLRLIGWEVLAVVCMLLLGDLLLMVGLIAGNHQQSCTLWQGPVSRCVTIGECG